MIAYFWQVFFIFKLGACNCTPDFTSSIYCQGAILNGICAHNQVRGSRLQVCFWKQLMCAHTHTCNKQYFFRKKDVCTHKCSSQDCSRKICVHTYYYIQSGSFQVCCREQLVCAHILQVYFRKQDLCTHPGFRFVT